MNPNCPQCQSPISIVPDTSPEQVTCPACGTKYIRAGDETIVVEGESATDTLTFVKAPSSTSERPNTQSSDAGQFGEYDLMDEIARGGMGVVYKARQRKLNRIVALKMIRAGELAGDGEIWRFQTEAEAAAALDHPNIVPIYEVGEFAGRHFFSMGYVDGPGLDVLLKEGPLEPRSAAALMKTIAEAVQYAHDKGIVHRDLKPANVLLADAASTSNAPQTQSERAAPSQHDSPPTACESRTAGVRAGTTWLGSPRITDFGLAKNIAVDSGITASGQVMGTPSYMPPEQAEGRLDEIGRHSDVYSLGAMLYATLTGRPPFQSASVMETLRQVLLREPVSPRQLNPAVDVDLETICLKCLEKEPAKRYSSARELAEELGRVLERKPILARPIGRIEQGWRWCRRNPLGTTVIALLILLAFGSTAAAVNRNQLVNETQKANSKLSESLKAETAAKQLAEEKEQLARRNLDHAAEVVQKFVVEIGKQDGPLTKYPGTQQVRRTLLNMGREYFEKLTSDNQTGELAGRVALAYYHLGMLLSQLNGDKPAALAAYQKSSAIIKQLPATSKSPEFLTALAVNYNNCGMLLNQMERRDEALEFYRRAGHIHRELLAEAPDDNNQLKSLAQIRLNTGSLLAKTGQSQAALAEMNAALKTATRLIRLYPNNIEFQNFTAIVHNNIGIILSGQNDVGKAIAAHKKSLAIKQRLAASHPSQPSDQHAIAASHMNLSGLYWKSGNRQQANSAIQQALTILEKLVRENPSVTEYQLTLADSYYSLGRLHRRTSGGAAEALVAYEKSLAIYDRLAKDNPSITGYQNSHAGLLNSIGLLKSEAGKPAEAMQAFRRASAILDRLTQQDDKLINNRLLFAISLYNIGRTLRIGGDTEQAEKQVRRANTILEQLVRENPEDAKFRKELAKTWNELAILNESAGKTQQALAAHHASLKHRKKLVDKNPDVPDYQNELAETYNNLGVLYNDMEDLKSALVQYQATLAIQTELVRKHPAVPAFQDGLSRSYNNIAIIYSKQRLPAQALAALQQAREIREQMVKQNPESTKYRSELSMILINIASQHLNQSQDVLALQAGVRAVKLLERLVEAEPALIEFADRLAYAYNMLGSIHATARRLREALAAHLKAITIWKKLVAGSPKNLRFQTLLLRSYGDVSYYYRQTGSPEITIEVVNKAIPIADRLPDNPSTRSQRVTLLANRALAFSALEQHANAIPDWRNVMKLSKQNPRLFYSIRFCMALAHTEKHAEATRRAGGIDTVGIPAGALYDIGCVFAIASRAADFDQNHSPATRARMASTYRRQSMRILQQVANVGFFRNAQNRHLLRTDPDLSPLRHLDTFREWAKSVGVSLPATARKPRSARSKQ